MEAVAKTKYLKGSPRKTRLVIDLIRGVNVSRALSILKFTDKRAAQPIAQCLNSAIANATFKAEQQNIAIDPDDLWVKACFVDMGPHKHRSRMRPAPQGRAYREQRHYCHITIEVTSDDKPKTEKELKADAAKARRAETGGKAKDKKAKAPAPKKEAKVADEVKPVEEIVDNTAHEKVETPDVKADLEAAKADAEVADAKNVETQTTAALNETKPADEKQQDINEELERQ
ncbi:MAG: 50S ribosomal protein L22 [Pyrinomonadaceae bacterium]